MFHSLISEFAKQADVPMVVNTSLNAFDDPMVCAPYQALRTFYTTGLDALFLGPFLLAK